MARFTPSPKSEVVQLTHKISNQAAIITQVRKLRLLVGGLSRLFQKIRGGKDHYSRFATELLLLLLVLLAVGANLSDRANSGKTVIHNRSLFFAYLKGHPELNKKLLDAYESVNFKLAHGPIFTKQILAANKKSESENENYIAALPTLSGSALLKPNPADSTALGVKRDIEVYEVKSGDTVARIATAYGVSVDTILWENNLASSGLIRPGQELKILPVSGVKHVVKKGENISSIAKKYGLNDPPDIEEMFAINGIEEEDGHIFPGDELIVPNGVKKIPLTPQRQQYLAEVQREDYQKVDVPADYQGGSANLIWPLPSASRLSQKYWSRHRAIDIPCRDCGIVAAAAGIVELAGWQKGYGNTVVINHGGGTKTRYAHGKQNLVAAGEQVEQGQQIMISGSTGRSSGSHLHFEVKINGELVNPLNYVSR